MNNPNALTNIEARIAYDAIWEQMVRTSRGVGCSYLDSRTSVLNKLRSQLDANIPTGGEVDVQT